MTLRFCLINPPHPYLVNPNAQAPLGLLYVASWIRELGYDVLYENYSCVSDIEHLEIPEADIYGITGTFMDVDSSNRLAKRIKQLYRKVAVVVGGPISLSHESLDFDYINSVVMREGEYAIPKIVQDLRDRCKLQKFYHGDRIEDLDSLPFPARDLVEGPLGGSIFAQGKNYYGTESTVLSTSRGCPSNCTFCASPKLWGRMVVHRSGRNVVKEVEHVINDFGVRQFRFSDDNLTADRTRLNDLCEAFGGLRIAWRASIRVKPCSVEMFRMMKLAGCQEVCFGIESGDDEVLRTLQKRTTVEENKIAIRNAKSADLDVRVLMMAGCPGETKRTLQRNIDFLDSIKGQYDAIALTNFTPLPGTQVALNPAKHGCEILDQKESKSVCFFDSDGEHKWTHFVRPVGLTMKELDESKKAFAEYVRNTGVLNEG